MTQGFQEPLEKSITITFHVIVPLPFWEWEDSTSSMHIRFRDDRLGHWKDCGDFTKFRHVPFQTLLITSAMHFGGRLLVQATYGIFWVNLKQIATQALSTVS